MLTTKDTTILTSSSEMQGESDSHMATVYTTILTSSSEIMQITSILTILK